jgi:hypothetical protein
MVNRAAAISGRSVFADVLDAPVSELTVSNHIDASKNFVDAGTLGKLA